MKPLSVPKDQGMLKVTLEYLEALSLTSKKAHRSNSSYARFHGQSMTDFCLHRVLHIENGGEFVCTLY